MEDLERPTGTRENPAMTCKDLTRCRGLTKDGMCHQYSTLCVAFPARNVFSLFALSTVSGSTAIRIKPRGWSRGYLASKMDWFSLISQKSYFDFCGLTSLQKASICQTCDFRYQKVLTSGWRFIQIKTRQETNSFPFRNAFFYVYVVREWWTWCHGIALRNDDTACIVRAFGTLFCIK